jgi:DNA replication protein DnaC
MNHEELLSSLKQLHLQGVATQYVELAKIAEKKQITYEQYLASCIGAELSNKHQQRVARLLKESKLDREKNVDQYDFSIRSGVSLKEIRRLAEGEFIKEACNVVFYGDIGVGKSHLAYSLVRELCGKGIKCYFTTTHQLIDDLVVAKSSLTLAKLLRKLDRFDLIVCDELGYVVQGKEGGELFFQFISQRYERKSVMFTTNLTFSEWDKVFGSPITTAAAVDRIIHKCETFNILGPSKRGEDAKKRIDLKQTGPIIQI